MGVWRRHVLPRIVDVATGIESTLRSRENVMPYVRGRVLELGAGSGHNLPLMDPELVERVWALDPEPLGWRLARERIDALEFETEFLEASAEEIPLEDDSVDTVLTTYALCTIPEPLAALSEMRRVLRPEGEFVFCEHGLADDESLRKWQHRLQPIWGRLAGGCHLNRPIPQLIESGGFEIQGLRTGFFPGPKPLRYTFWGTARIGDRLPISSRITVRAQSVSEGERK